MREFLYDIGPVAAGVVILAMVAIPMVVVAWVVGRRQSGAERGNDNSMTAAQRLLAPLFAFAFSLVVLALFQQLTEARLAVAGEAGALTSLDDELVSFQALPPAATATLRADLRSYADVVADEEWPHMADEGSQSPEARAIMRRIGSTLSDAGARNADETEEYSQLVRSLDRLENARAERIAAVSLGLPAALWALMATLAAAAVMVVAAYPRGPSVRFRVAQIALVAAGVSVALLTLTMLENPYRGMIRIPPDPITSFAAQS